MRMMLCAQSESFRSIKAIDTHQTRTPCRAINYACLLALELVQNYAPQSVNSLHAYNALSTAAWHCVRGEPGKALSRMRRAQSHISASMEGRA
jgi:hypothetical protein